MGELVGSFNEMAIALERLQKEEAAKLRLESELQVARSVQEHLFPRVVPVLRGATVAGRTLEARTIGGDLYDFFDLGQERIGILCADVSGKGIPAALMMANLQAIARAHLGDRIARPDCTARPFRSKYSISSSPAASETIATPLCFGRSTTRRPVC